MARNYRGNRNNRRGGNAGSNPPPPPNNNAGSGGANPPPPANTNTLAQTISAYLQGADIMAKVYKLYLGLFIGILIVFASQFAAGALAFNHGRGTMAMFEWVMVLVILFLWFLPHILITGGIVSTAAAINSPNLLTDQAVIKFAVFWVKGFLSVCAYTIGIVFTVLLLFNIKNDYNGLAILIVVGTFIGIFTVVIGDAGTLTPKLMRAGLVGFVVMILLTYLPGVDGESAVRDFLVTHNVLAGIATFVVIVVGTSNLGTFKDWSWGKLAWLLSVKNLLKLIGFALFLFVVYWFFNPKDATRILSAKVTEIQDATSSTPTPSSSASDNSQVGKANASPKTVIKPFNGKAVMAIASTERKTSSCAQKSPLIEILFSPSTETFNHKPLLATINKGNEGSYLITVEGSRKQGFLTNGQVSNYRLMDADGNMIDESPAKQWLTNDSLFPTKPYGGIVLHANEKMVYIGSKKKFKIDKIDQADVSLSLDINVYQHPDNYTSTDSSMKVRLFKCN